MNPPLYFTGSKYSMPVTRGKAYTAEAVNRGGISVLPVIAEVLDTPFNLIAKLQEISESKSTHYDALVGYHEVSNFNVSCFCEVWNADISDVVWEGEASCTSQASYMTTERKGYDEFAKIAGKGLVNELLNWPKKWKE